MLSAQLRFRSRTLFRLILASAILSSLVISPVTSAQTELASLSGRVTDTTGAVLIEAEVEVRSADTNIVDQTKTNRDGLYVFPNLRPGHYLVTVSKPGFRTIDLTGLTLYTQDKVDQNFVLPLGAVSESMTVRAEGTNVNTTDAAVSTVVDRKFVDSMPLNGRSFQSLLTLAPGVTLVVSPYGVGGSGEITVNGQRTEANYFTVDGVSVNTGTMPTNVIGGAGFSGGTPGETIAGTTQSMVSVDALQEFRASTSTYSAEFGRTPGGQFSFTTRSGTNNWHGSLFDYLRNDAMDANNWFNNHASPKVARQAERQNDFGGTLGGPLVIPGLYNGRDKTFFFFSYEGLRLTAPQAFQQFSVPDMTLRQLAPAALHPFLNAFPVPNGGEDGLNDGLAFFNLAYSAPTSLDNIGIRIDHDFGDKLKVFGRFANTPSTEWTRANAIKATTVINVRTLTVGATSSLTQRQSNEFRFNITQNNMAENAVSTNFGGATPLDFGSLPGPSGQPFSSLGSQVTFFPCWGGCPNWTVLSNTNTQRQYNVTDTYSWAHGRHQTSFGVDWRRLTTYVRPITLDEFAEFLSEGSLLANSLDSGTAASFTSMPVTPVYHNFSAFIEDEWKAKSNLSLSLGLRWDINPAPGNLSGPIPYTADQITSLATTKLAPAGTPLWNTDWHGFAPRIGIAYQLHQARGHETVVRTGFGIFYDMGNTQGSNGFTGVGFSTGEFYSGVPFPLTSAQVTLPAPSLAPPYFTVYAFDPNLKLPYTLQWNVAVEQGLGGKQTLTASYVGSSGRSLLATFLYYPATLGNPDYQSGGILSATSNMASSDYNSVQVKYQKSLSRGVQALASYTWSHSIDNASSNFFLNDELLRASSDFDVRHNFEAAITYDVSWSLASSLASALLTHWGADARIFAHSSLPVDVIGTTTPNPVTGLSVNYNPNVVPGQPPYLYSSQYPGGRIINYNAFTPAPTGVEGDSGRNSLRGFDAVQTDLALRRIFSINERLQLQFRADAFNVLNHPIFGSIYNQLSYGPTQFGYAYNTTNNSLGGLSSLYQVGGPRSIQIALRLQF